MTLRIVHSDLGDRVCVERICPAAPLLFSTACPSPPVFLADLGTPSDLEPWCRSSRSGSGRLSFRSCLYRKVISSRLMSPTWCPQVSGRSVELRMKELSPLAAPETRADEIPRSSGSQRTESVRLAGQHGLSVRSPRPLCADLARASHPAVFVCIGRSACFRALDHQAHITGAAMFITLRTKSHWGRRRPSRRADVRLGTQSCARAGRSVAIQWSPPAMALGARFR